MAALDDLIAIYKEAQLALIKIITGNTGAGTKTYYNTILKQTETLLNRLCVQTGRYISTEIPKEYKVALDQTYAYFKRNNLQMNRPDMFAQIHSDAVSELAAEMQHHIDEGISNAGRRVIRYADSARDNALRQNGLKASAVKIASGQTVRDMQKDLMQRLSQDGFLTVQYGSGDNAYQVGLDSYAAMVARSTTREAGNLARENQLTENGYDLMMITEHHPCCGQCAKVQGRVFSISGKDKRFPPLSAAFPSGYQNVHPNCSCVAVPWIEELQSPEELKEALEKGSQPLKDERSSEEKALYTKQQSDSRRMRSDLIQYERYKARLGSDAPKSFSAFRRMKNAGGDRWEELQREYRQRFEKAAAEERKELLSQNKVDIHNSAVDNSEISDIISLRDDNSSYKSVTQEAIERVPKLNIFDDDEMNKRHQQAAKDLLTEVKKRDDVPVGTEFSIRYNKDMKPINGETYLQGEKGSVPLHDYGEPFHAFHNHGSNGSLSYNDLRKFASLDNMLSLTAQGNLGNMYTVVASDSCDREGYRLFLKRIGEKPICIINGQKISLDFFSNKENEITVDNMRKFLSDEEKEKISAVIISRIDECLNGGAEYGVKYYKA